MLKTTNFISFFEQTLFTSKQTRAAGGLCSTLLGHHAQFYWLLCLSWYTRYEWIVPCRLTTITWLPRLFPVEHFRYDEVFQFKRARLEELPWTAFGACMGLGFSLSLLFFMDQNISAAMVNNPCNKWVDTKIFTDQIVQFAFCKLCFLADWKRGVLTIWICLWWAFSMASFQCTASLGCMEYCHTRHSMFVAWPTSRRGLTKDTYTKCMLVYQACFDLFDHHRT